MILMAAAQAEAAEPDQEAKEHKTDAVNKPIQYAIGFDMTVETDDHGEKAQDVIRLARAFLCTTEAAGVKQASPVTYGNVACSQQCALRL